MARKRTAMRTKKGNVTAIARKKAGSKKKGAGKGKFPIFDHTSCMSAVRLRHHGKGIGPTAVLAKASRYATAHKDSA